MLESFTLEISNLIKARFPYIAINTFDEELALSELLNLSKERNPEVFIWSRTKGITKDRCQVCDIKDPLKVLDWYEEHPSESLLILLDYDAYAKDHSVARKLRDLSPILKNSKKSIIFLSPNWEAHPSLDKTLQILDMPLPKIDEIRDIIQNISQMASIEIDDDYLTEISHAATGLSQEEIENVLAKSLVKFQKFDTSLIQDEKKNIVKKSGILEFVESNSNHKTGGLGELKNWLKIRKIGLKNRITNLPPPKGILLVGIPGCGKSLSAVSISLEWQLPLLRLDVGKVFSGLVGSSEANLRKALTTAEAVSPCILWIDEIDKVFAGSSGQSDGGTSARVFGSLLTWMQEKKSPVFVMATANSISHLPPEFLRKGRFDEIFFVDLPTEDERAEILEILCKKYQLKLEDPTIPKKVSHGLSGSEIEQAIISASYDALSEGRSVNDEDVIKNIRNSVPLSITMKAEITALRDWASTRAKFASKDNTDQSNFPRTRINQIELGDV